MRNGRLLVHLTVHHLQRVITRKGEPPSQQLEENYASGVQISGRPDRFTERLFRSHVCGSAKRHPSSCQMARVGGACDAKITELDCPITRQQELAGLTSRCTTLLRWITSSASSMPCMRESASGTLSGARARIRSLKLPPSTSSITV